MKFRLNRPSLQLTFHSLRVLLGRSILDCCTRLSSTHNRLQNNSCRNFTLKQQWQQLFGQLHSWKWKCVSKTIYLTRSFDGWTNALRPVDSQIKFLLSHISLSLSRSLTNLYFIRKFFQGDSHLGISLRRRKNYDQDVVTSITTSVTILGYLLDFGQLFKAFGYN